MEYNKIKEIKYLLEQIKNKLNDIKINLDIN